jgi:hypothetical protein
VAKRWKYHRLSSSALVSYLLIVTGSAVGAQHCPGGTLTGETGSCVICKNLTTGQEVVLPLRGGRTWDCTAAGLIVHPGDRVRHIVHGKVPLPTTPPTPRNLVACSPALGSVLLQWPDTSVDETRFEITKFGTLEKTVEADVTSALITGLKLAISSFTRQPWFKELMTGNRLQASKRSVIADNGK